MSPVVKVKVILDEGNPSSKPKFEDDTNGFKCVSINGDIDIGKTPFKHEKSVNIRFKIYSGKLQAVFADKPFTNIIDPTKDCVGQTYSSDHPVSSINGKELAVEFDNRMNQKDWSYALAMKDKG